MPRSRFLTLTAAIAFATVTTLATLATLALEGRAWAGPLQPSLAPPLAPARDDWEGLSQFVQMAQGELGPQRVVVTSTLDLGELRRADALVIVHPERALDPEELAVFMRSGGRVILLDDYGTGDQILTHFGIRRVPMPQRPAAMLRGNPALAIADAVGTHATVRNVGRVVTNHATGVENPALAPILVVHGEEEPDVLLAVGGAVGQGRLVVMGDSSIVMNAMLRYPGNRALSVDLVRFATEDDAWGRQNGKLYVLVNDFEVTGSFGVDPGLGGLAERTWHSASEALETLRHEGMPPLVAYAGALAIGLGVVVWTSQRAGKTHRPSPPRFARPTPVVAHGGVAGHAASLSAPGAARVLTMLELKSALEDDLSARLGLDRAPPYDVLVARVRAARLLDDDGARDLSRLFETLAPYERVRLGKRHRALERPRDAEVMAVAARVRNLLAAAAQGPSRDTVEKNQ
jgi:hypothetical protein